MTVEEDEAETERKSGKEKKQKKKRTEEGTTCRERGEVWKRKKSRGERERRGKTAGKKERRPKGSSEKKQQKNRKEGTKGNRELELRRGEEKKSLCKTGVEASRKEGKRDAGGEAGEKRAKIIQRSLLSVSPGAWLTDMCQERYEVREKKSNKKRPRGLKEEKKLNEKEGEEERRWAKKFTKNREQEMRKTGGGSRREKRREFTANWRRKKLLDRGDHEAGNKNERRKNETETNGRKSERSKNERGNQLKREEEEFPRRKA